MPRRSTEVLKSRLRAGSYAWEREEFDDAHAAFTRWADMVRDRPASVDRRKKNLFYASLYGSLPLLGFGINSYTRSIPFQGAITLNVVQNAIDSYVAKVCKNRPRPMFSTTEAPFEIQEAVHNADLYVEGLFYEQRYYHTTFPGRTLDMAIYGLGVTKTYELDGWCQIDRVYPWEMIVDDRECMYGDPVRIGQRKWYDKQLVFDLNSREDDIEWNRDLEEAIEGASKGDSGWDDPDKDDTTDQILVFEGWRKPTPKTKGKLLRCIRGKTLGFDDIEISDKASAFTFVRPGPQSMGFWGVGICEKIAGIQKEINRIVQDVQRAMHLIAKPHWMVEASSNVLATSLNNDMATIVKYQGAVPPQVYTPQAMSPEVYQHLQFLYKTAYELTGVSQASAQSQKPAGVNTGVGIRTYLNIESDRFDNYVRGSDEAVSEDALKAARVLGGLKRPRAVNHFDKREGAKKIEWDKLDLDSVMVQVQPGSKLPDTDAGKREYALELAQYNVAKPDDVYEMLEWGDTEAFAKRRLAGRRNVERDIMKLRRGEKVVRDAIGDHATALQMMSDAYEEAKHDGVPVERLAKMRMYVRACRKFLGLPDEPGTAPPKLGPDGQALPVGPDGLPLPPMPPPGAPLLPVPPGMPPPNMAPPGTQPEAPLPQGPPM